MTIATVTVNPAVDKSCSVDRVVPEHKLRCDEPGYDPGGGGLNVARAATILGGDVTAVWTCGGYTGALLGDLLNAAGLRHEAVPIEAMTRENLAVYEASSGLQYRFGMPGAPLSAAEADRCQERIAALDPRPEILVLSGSLPPGMDEGFYADAIRSRPEGTRVLLDTSGAPLRAALDVGVFLVKPNLRELEQAQGRALETDGDIEAAARRLADGGHAEVVVVSLGAGGSLLVTADRAVSIRSPTVPIRSKVGAGDSMVAGIACALARGQSIEDAARFGVAAGAAAVMTPGSALCTRPDTERLYAHMAGAALA